MFKILASVITLVIVAWGAPVIAQDQRGLYIGVAGGLVFGGETRGNGDISSPDSELDGQPLGTSDTAAKGQFDSSLSTSFTAGYDMGSFRVEGELFYQKADTDDYQGLLDGTTIDPPGQVNTSLLGVAANVAYDIGQFGIIRPYVTLGVGQAKVDTKYVFPTRGEIQTNGNSIVFQGGFGMDISYTDNTTIDVKYRFRRVGTNEKGIDGDFDSSILEVGIRYEI